MITLENSAVRAVIAPEFGGRVWEFRDLTRNRQWIWHRPGVPLREATETDVYDEVWAGGWEELFPNDAAGNFEGRRLTDHGEWWRLRWTIDQLQQGPNPTLTLSATTGTRSCRCIKRFTLQSSPPGLRVSYRIESNESASFHFLLKLHLAVAIEPGCTLRVPGGTVTAVDPSFGTLLRGAGPFDWASLEVQPVRAIPEPRSDAREFVYVSNLPEGWCGVDDGAARASLRLHFDTAVLPYTWLFLSYGGWRDCYTAVLEPCTNMPKDLSAAVRAGQSARLEPGGLFETEVTALVGGLPA